MKKSQKKPDLTKLERKKKIRGLRKALDYINSYTDKNIRLKAAEILGDIGGKKVLKHLVYALNNMYPEVVAKALEGIRKMEPATAKNAIGAVIEQWKVSKQEEVRREAKKTINHIGTPAVIHIVPFLEDKNPGIRRRAIDILGDIGDLSVSDSLVESLKDKHYMNRIHTAYALEKMGWKPAKMEDKIRYYFVSSDWMSFRECGDSAFEFLRKNLDFSVDKDMRRHTVSALSEWKDDKTLELLIKALKDRDAMVCSKARDLLRKMGGDDAAPLLRVFKESDDVQIISETARLLGDLNEKRAVKPLIDALRDKRADIKNTYIDALAKIRTPESIEVAVEAFTEKLQNGPDSRRGEAAEKLAEFGEKIALEPLLRSLNAAREGKSGVWSHYTQRRISQALAKYGDKRAVENVIDYLFEYPGESSHWRASSLKRLFGDYAEYILGVTSYRKKSDVGLAGQVKKTTYSHVLDDMSLKKLMEISSPISTNILHKVARKGDIEVVVSSEQSCGNPVSRRTLSCQHQRKMAGEELARRGNPSYDPAAYLNEDLWKIE